MYWVLYNISQLQTRSECWSGEREKLGAEQSSAAVGVGGEDGGGGETSLWQTPAHHRAAHTSQGQSKSMDVHKAKNSQYHISFNIRCKIFFVGP